MSSLDKKAVGIGTVGLLLGVPLFVSTALADSVTAPKAALFFCAAWLVIAGWVRGAAQGRWPLLALTPAGVAAAGYFGWTALRGLVAGLPPTGFEETLQAFTLALLALAWTATGAARDPIGPALAGALVAAYSLLQRFDLDPLHWKAPDTYPTMLTVRTISTMGNPNYLGAFLVTALPLLLAASLQRKGSARALGLCAWAVAAAATIMVQNRSSWLALALSTGVLVGSLYRTGAREPLKHLLLACAGAAVVTLGLSLAQAPPSARSEVMDVATRTRAFLWQSAWKIGCSRPLAGVGPGGYTFPALAYRDLEVPEMRHLQRLPEDPHNEYLKAFAEGGLGAVLLLLSWLGLLAWELARRPSPESLFRLGALAALGTSLLFISATLSLWLLALALLGTSAQPAGARPGRAAPVLAAAVWLAASCGSARSLLAERKIWWGDEFLIRARAAPQDRRVELLEQAARSYQEAAALAWPGRQADIWTRLGSSYMEAYRGVAPAPEVAEWALEAYGAASELEPGNPYPHASIAAVRGLLNQPGQELEGWDRAIDRDPWNPAFLAGKAGSLARAGRFEEAAGYYRRSLESGPRQPQVALEYGRVLHELGRTEEARRWWARAVELDPSLKP